ncbi:MAG: asparagine synthase (glutamine-hydrolyzing) [Oscillospiraceae bacterium]|jgi:asparagine synthase (glutamine-hydrolysing)|nr:asparagine synthase (glutamine-hydrolyzing) [Oscillospiraceae bacterium]
MCGIAGMCAFDDRWQAGDAAICAKLKMAGEALRHRGPDGGGIFADRFIAMTHRRLAIIDPKLGAQPMRKTQNGRTGVLVYNGELYNTQELRVELSQKGWSWETASDTEVLLAGLLQDGIVFLEKVNGIFAFAFWDGETLLLARDRLGVKPLFYAMEGDLLFFGSEPKALFACGFKPRMDKTTLCELFALGPAHTPGNGVFKGVCELLPAQWLQKKRDGVRVGCYWRLESKVFTDSERECVAKTSFLLQDAVERQMVSDVPICTFLSGGLDSSLATAIVAKKLREQGRRLATFSFDFKGNDAFYTSNAFQPSRDAPFAREMAAYLQTDHTELECGNADLADLLDDAMVARDLPGMADVDASLLYFCKIVGKQYKVTMTGETADEIFGGYPWFRSEAAFRINAFPWSQDMEIRKTFLRGDVLRELDLNAYAADAYAASIAQTPRLASDTPEEARRREIAWLNLEWFMQTLLSRMDRCSMSACLEARVPFADHRILEYVWNIPWSIKYKNGVEKSVLREAGRGWLPDSVLWRKKSPYPKTYHPAYENLLKERMRDILASPNEPLHTLIDRAKAEAFLDAPADYGKPWFGQLMAAPQRIAYFLQMNAWLRRYF